MTGFAELPGRIAALTREHERVAVVLLDAFGWKFVQRHADHPFLRRLEIEPVASQFPSTTTAHLTTLYTGLPVEQHGLYEWHVYDPGLDTIILPLPFVRADDGPLPLDPRDVVPGPTLFEQLDVPSLVLQQSTIWPGKYGSAAFAGARVLPFERFEEATAQLGGAGLTYIYWDAIDATGHRHGPSSREFDAAALAALDALDARARHVHPRHRRPRADRRGRAHRLPRRAVAAAARAPARSRAGGLRARLLPARARAGDGRRASSRRAWASTPRCVLAAELFPDAGPRLLARLADVCVLPAPGRMAWLRSNPSHQLRFKGHHGGRTPEESETWVGIMQT